MSIDTPIEQPRKQHEQPGQEWLMREKPVYIRDNYCGSDKLKDKVALITGGDSGIGRAVAVHFAREGAAVALAYLSEKRDAEQTQQLVEQEGAFCITLEGDIGDPHVCDQLVQACIRRFGRLDILVNNAAEQHLADELESIDRAQLEQTFATNIFGPIDMVKAALPKMPRGGNIINTTSVTAYRGSAHLIDYSATKGAIVSFTRSLAKQLAQRDIRVNGVAPGPIWTPLIPATFPEEALKHFGQSTPMGRPGQPAEVAPAFVFLASEDASYMTGQILHPNGGGAMDS